MSIHDIIKNRRSVRSFKPDPLAPGVLEKIKEAIKWAPSAGNLQSRHFYFVFNEGVRKALAEAAYGQSFIAEAPLVVVATLALGDVERKYGQKAYEYAVQDTAAALENAFLAAESEGAGGCWVGAFEKSRVRTLLNLPQEQRPLALAPLGYPIQRPPAPARKSDKKLFTDIK